MEYRYQVVARETEPEAAPQAPYRGISEGWAPSCEQLVAVHVTRIPVISPRADKKKCHCAVRARSPSAASRARS